LRVKRQDTSRRPGVRIVRYAALGFLLWALLLVLGSFREAGPAGRAALAETVPPVMSSPTLTVRTTLPPSPIHLPLVLRYRPPLFSATRDDTTLSSLNPDAWYGDRDDLVVGYCTDPELPMGNASAILRFDLSGLPSGVAMTGVVMSGAAMTGAAVERAVLRPYLSWYAYREGHAPELVVRAHRVVSPWPARPTWRDLGQAYGEAYGADVAGLAWGYLELEVTALVRGWLDGTWPNDGLMLRGGQGGYDNVRGFYSANAEKHRPRLLITYVNGLGERETAILEAEATAPAERDGAAAMLRKLDSREWCWAEEQKELGDW
jgi:hypothetical protein